MTSLSPVFKRAQPVCGTCLEISLSAPDRELADASMSAAFEVARRLESVFNLFDPKSELSHVNAAAPETWVRVSPDLAEVLHFGAELEARSGGAFSLRPACAHGSAIDLSEAAVWRPCECPFDLGGVAKGYIVDRVFLELERRHPGARIVVNAGGDLRGSHAHTVELRIPASGEEIRYQVTIERGALATSARSGTPFAGTASARFPAEHPRYADSPSRAASATVFASSCLVADAMTKVALFGDPYAPAVSEFPLGKVLRFTDAGIAV